MQSNGFLDKPEGLGFCYRGFLVKVASEKTGELNIYPCIRTTASIISPAYVKAPALNIKTVQDAIEWIDHYGIGYLHNAGVNKLTVERIKDLLEESGHVTFGFINRDIVLFERVYPKDHQDFGNVPYIRVGYGKFELTDGEEQHLLYQPNYYDIRNIDNAVDCFIDIVKNGKSAQSIGNGEKPDTIIINTTRQLFFQHTYKYLEVMLEPFWKLVFNKTPEEMHCESINLAHGDGAYSHINAWEDAGINRNRGTLLFLLTFTKEFGDTPKHDSGKWVIANYSKYWPAIKAAEYQILLEKYGIEK